MEVSQQFQERWLSGKHVGEARPVQFGRVRRGAFLKHHRPFTFLDGSTEDFATIPVSSPRTPFAAKWYPHSDWMDLPNLTDVNIQQNFETNGVRTATITIDNIVWKAIAGVVGTYHLARRGYLSPLRAYTAPWRHAPSWHEINEWVRIFESSSQVDIFQGYGDATPRVFTGLIDQVDMSSSPDTIVMTVRGFAGPMLTDQRMFGRNKDPRLRVPITFADRRSSYDEKKVSGGAKASSHHRTHPARNITRADSTSWLSQGRLSPDHSEWCQITLTAGHYETFRLFPQYANMEAYVSVRVQNRRDRRRYWTPHSGGLIPAKKAKVDDAEVNEGWYDPVTEGSWSDLTDAEKDARIASGDGMVPDTDIPYVRHFKRLDNVGKAHKLGHKFEVGAGTKLRITFRHLHHSAKYGDFRAGAKRLIAYALHKKADAKKNQWILVDDASDVVKVVLRWAGYREWEVEDFGWRIEKDKPWVFHQSDFFIDVINYVKSQGDFVFFEKPPTTHDESLGVPVFRHSRALRPPGDAVLGAADFNLLTGVNATLNVVGRPSIVHVRGREAKKGQHGRSLGEDRAKRVWAKYIPPWGTKHSTRYRQANILRHHTHFDPNLTTNGECKVAAVLIAIQYQLQSFTAHIEIPGHPGAELDDHVSIRDEGTGVDTRIWVADIQSQFTSGEQAKWTVTIGGALIDTEDMVLLGRALNDATAFALKQKDDAKVFRPGHFTVTDEESRTFKPDRATVKDLLA
jgi:hypothetical protein